MLMGLQNSLQRLLTPIAVLCILGIVLSGEGTFSEEETALSGRVVDGSTGEALVGANVLLIGTPWGASTDEDGKYSISGMSPGAYRVEVKMIGYREEKRTVRIGPGEKAVLDFKLELQPLPTDGIVVTAERELEVREREQVSVRPMKPRQAKAMPGAGEDVFRALQSLPGVLSRGDFSPQLYVRGGGPDQNLILMDDVTIFNPYRLFGLISMFNPETVEDIQLLAGGFPARYGNRLSAVLDVRNKEGDRQSLLSGNLNGSITNANFVLEGKIPKVHGSWLFSSRRTYYDVVAQLFLEEDLVLPHFSDVQGKLVLEPASGHKFVVNAITSGEGMDVHSPAERDEPDSMSAVSTSHNDVIGLGWQWTIRPNLLSKALISRYDNFISADFEGRVEGDSEEMFDLRFKYKIGVEEYGIKEALIYFPTSAHEVEVGGEVMVFDTQIEWEMDIPEEWREERGGGRDEREQSPPDKLDQKKRAFTAAAYLQDRWDFRDDLTVQSGLRYDYSAVIERGTVAPRLSFAYRPDVLTIKGAWGFYYQSPGYETLMDQDFFVDLEETNALDLKSEKATHYIAGIERWLSETWKVKMEVYDKELDDLIVPEKVTVTRTEWQDGALVETLEDSLTTIPVNDARGRAVGIEFLLEKKHLSENSRFSGWVSYAWAKASWERDGRTMALDYDQRHTINVVANYEVREGLEVGLKWRFGSGFPYTPPVGLEPKVRDGVVVRDEEGEIEYEMDYGGEENKNSAQYPWYHRLDLRVSFEMPGFLGMDWTLYADIINVYNHTNIFQYTWDPETYPEREDIGMFPFLPTLGVSMRF